MMNRIAVNGISLEVNENGFLVHTDEWSVAIAEYIAKGDGLEMTSFHWEVVNFLREYYRLYQIAPMVKVITREIGKKFGVKKAIPNICLSSFQAAPRSRPARLRVFQIPMAAFNRSKK